MNDKIKGTNILDDEELRLILFLLVNAIEWGDKFSIIDKYVKIVKKLEKYFKENTINQ